MHRDIQAYRQRDMETYRHADRDRHADRQTDRQTDSQTDIYAYVLYMHVWIHTEGWPRKPYVATSSSKEIINYISVQTCSSRELPVRCAPSFA